MLDFALFGHILSHVIKEPIETGTLKDYYAGPKTRHGYPYSCMGRISRGFCWFFLPVSIILLAVCIFNPDFFITNPEDSQNDVYLVTAIAAVLFLMCMFILRYKNIIMGNTLVVRRLFTKRRIPLEELRMAALRKPPEKSPARYAGSFTFATNSRNIHIVCLNSRGGIQLVKQLCHYSQVPLPRGYSEMAVRNRLSGF